MVGAVKYTSLEGSYLMILRLEHVEYLFAGGRPKGGCWCRAIPIAIGL
jgi:hypothetical protein